MAGMTPQDAAEAAAEAAQAAQLAAERAQALADQARLVADAGGSGLDPVFLQIAAFVLVALLAAGVGGVVASHRGARQVVPFMLAGAGLACLVLAAAALFWPAGVGMQGAWTASKVKLAGMAIAALAGAYAGKAGVLLLARDDGFSPRIRQLEVSNTILGVAGVVVALLAMMLLAFGHPVALLVLCTVGGASAAAMQVLPANDAGLERVLPMTLAAAGIGVAAVGVMLGNVAFVVAGLLTGAAGAGLAAMGGSALGSNLGK
jgi:NAD/NADP transhydrogenase beta subunit